jgi:hypothetical protein
MRTLVVSLALVLVFASSAAAAHRAQPSPRVPKATTLVLDSFTLSPDATNSTDTFWCSFNDYGAFFANYSGQCPTRDYVASVHWKKAAGATEYQVCLEPSFHDYTPGFACWVVEASNAGNPASLTMTFDSASMFLNAVEGTTQTWLVRACNLDPVTNSGPCSESNTVTADIPWTG